MGKTVVVAEKPSVGQSIAKVLNCTRNEDGYREGGQYIVTWAVGHLVTLQEPDEIDARYKTWKTEDLPFLPTDIPLKVVQPATKQFNIVKRLINSPDTDEVVCATDAGREGELIFRYIYTQAGCKKPFRRLWISSMTDEAIRNGFRQLRPGSEYDALYRSAKSRSEADWLVGMNATRAYSLRYDVLLSVGRVQTPTLAFLVKRRRDIENFVPEGYYLLKASFGDYTGVMFSPRLDPDTHIKERSQAEKAAELVRGKTGVITEAETQRKKEQPPQLYDLTTLQRDANRRFGFTADKTLRLAQSLYEQHKALTYPRTDSRYLPDDMIPVVAQTIRNLPNEYSALAAGALNNGKVTVTKRNFDGSKVSDHHAILPTNQTAVVARMSEDEKKLFDMVVKRMLEAFYPPCEYDATRIITTVLDRFTFRTSGKTIINPGWRAVRKEFGSGEESKDKEAENGEQEGTLPVVRVNETRRVEDTEVKQAQTKAPPHYTDASLLLAMETAGKDSTDDEIVQQMKGHGIGTPATRAAIIERLIEVNYAERKGKQIIATDKGTALIQIMPEQISSAETTGRWEMALNQIAENRRDPQSFMESIRKFTVFLVDHAKTNTEPFNEDAFDKERRKKPRAERMNGSVCPVCGKGEIIASDIGFSCSRRVEDGCTFNLWKNAFEKKYGFSLTQDTLTALFNREVLRRDRTGATDDVAILYEDLYGFKTISCYSLNTLELEMTASVENRKELCPVCKKKELAENVWGYSCGNCHIMIWKTAFARDGGPKLLTREIMEDLLTEGKAPVYNVRLRDANITESTDTNHVKEGLGVCTMDDDSLAWYADDVNGAPNSISAFSQGSGKTGKAGKAGKKSGTGKKTGSKTASTRKRRTTRN